MLLQRTTEEIYRRLSLSFFGKESVKKIAICLFRRERFLNFSHFAYYRLAEMQASHSQMSNVRELKIRF